MKTRSTLHDQLMTNRVCGRRRLVSSKFKPCHRHPGILHQPYISFPFQQHSHVLFLQLGMLSRVKERSKARIVADLIESGPPSPSRCRTLSYRKWNPTHVSGLSWSMMC